MLVGLQTDFRQQRFQHAAGDLRVQRIRRASFGASIKSLNSFEAIASTAAEGCFQGYDPFRFPEVYDSITQQDLLDFIRDNIRPERMALSIIYPKE